MIRSTRVSSAADVAGDLTTMITNQILTVSTKKRGTTVYGLVRKGGTEAMTVTHKDKFYIYVADICDFIHNAVCCDYNNALVFLYELIDEIPESQYPVKGCILNNNFDVVYKAEVKEKNEKERS